MTNAIASEINALQRMTTNELLEQYAELHTTRMLSVGALL